VAEAMLTEPVAVARRRVEVPDACTHDCATISAAASSLNTPLKLPIGAPPKPRAVNVKPDRS
jgi:hypothetical protein